MELVTLGGTFEFNNEEVTIPFDPFQDALDYDFTLVYIENNPYQGGYYIYYCYSKEVFKFSNYSGGQVVAKNTLVKRRLRTSDDVISTMTNNNFPDFTTWGQVVFSPSQGVRELIYTNYDIVDVESDDVVYPSNAVNYPFFDNTTQITNSTYSYMFISPRRLFKNR